MNKTKEEYYYLTFKTDEFGDPELVKCHDIEYYIQDGNKLLNNTIQEHKELQEELIACRDMSIKELKEKDIEYEQGYALGYIEAVEQAFLNLNIMVKGITDDYIEDEIIYKIPKKFLADVYYYIEKNLDYSDWMDFDCDEKQEYDVENSLETIEELTQYEVDYFEEQYREDYINLFSSNFASKVGEEAWTFASSKNDNANLLSLYEEWGLDYSGEYGTHTRLLVDLMEEMGLFKK